MKLRSVMFVGALAAMSVASAGTVVTGSNICGLQLVPSTASTTIIAVPWLNVGGGNVKVCDLVKTDTLTVGDKLFYYNDSHVYEAWEIKNVSGVNKWDSVTTVGTQGTVSYGIGSADKTLPRGKALFLYRQNTSSPIYLYGQYTTDSAAITVGAGDSDTEVWTMVANPRATDIADLNTVVSGTSGANDKILVAKDDGTWEDACTYSDGKWGRLEKDMENPITVGSKTVYPRVRNTTIPVKAGRGFWYVSKGGTPTFTF